MAEMHVVSKALAKTDFGRRPSGKFRLLKPKTWHKGEKIAPPQDFYTIAKGIPALMEVQDALQEARTALGVAVVNAGSERFQVGQYSSPQSLLSETVISLHAKIVSNYETAVSEIETNIVSAIKKLGREAAGKVNDALAQGMKKARDFFGIGFFTGFIPALVGAVIAVENLVLQPTVVDPITGQVNQTYGSFALFGAVVVVIGISICIMAKNAYYKSMDQLNRARDEFLKLTKDALHGQSGGQK